MTGTSWEAIFLDYLQWLLSCLLLVRCCVKEEDRSIDTTTQYDAALITEREQWIDIILHLVASRGSVASKL